MGRTLRIAVVYGMIACSASAQGFELAIETVSPRVVRLYGMKAGLSAGYESGTLVSDDGLVVTVLSLLLDSQRLRAVIQDGTMFGAEVIASDEERQLALLRLTPMSRYDRRGNRIAGGEVGPGRFDYFESGNSRNLTPGDWVLAAGNPFKVAEGPEPISVASGVFSVRVELDAKRKTRAFPYHGEVLVIDAITSTPGSPGGPLVDIDGQWLGVVGRIVVSNRTRTNLNYAIPVEVVQAFVESALNPGSPDKSESAARSAPYHGIKLFELGYRKKLVYVERVKRKSPAQKAGIRKDDLIVSVGGRNVSDIQSFKTLMNAKSPGDKVDVVVIRGEQLENFTLTLEESR